MPSLQYKLFSKIISVIPLKLRLISLYYRRFGYLPDLKRPSTFNEKLQYKKLHDRNPLLTIAADKLASKLYVKGKVPEIYIPKTLWQGTDINEIQFEKLPNDYVFKANHTSQTIEIIRSGKHLSSSLMKKLTRSWLKHDQSGALGEWAYENIVPQVFVEEFLDFNDTVPDDYKFFVFNGKVKLIQLDTGRFKCHRRNMFNREWEELGFEYNHKRLELIPEKPMFIDKMVEYAEILGKDFDFIRVDFYFYKRMITYGELTVYPGAGFEKFPTKELDLEFGEYWNLDS